MEVHRVEASSRKEVTVISISPGSQFAVNVDSTKHSSSQLCSPFKTHRSIMLAERFNS